MSTRQRSSLAHFLAKRTPTGGAVEQAKAENKPQSTPFFDQVVEGASGTESFEALLTKITGPVDPEDNSAVSDCPMPHAGTSLQL